VTVAVVIGQIVTETVLGDGGRQRVDAPTAARSQDELETIVRRATERVLETLRREWDR
jgi:hypothetical protein